MAGTRREQPLRDDDGPGFRSRESTGSVMGCCGATPYALYKHSDCQDPWRAPTGCSQGFYLGGLT